MGRSTGNTVIKIKRAESGDKLKGTEDKKRSRSNRRAANPAEETTRLGSLDSKEGPSGGGRYVSYQASVSRGTGKVPGQRNRQ